jgi:uracil-DNA glycosylase
MVGWTGDSTDIAADCATDNAGSKATSNAENMTTDSADSKHTEGSSIFTNTNYTNTNTNYTYCSPICGELERSCEGAFAYFHGLKGKNSGLTGIMLVANRSDSRALLQAGAGGEDYAYKTALSTSKTGMILAELLSTAKLGFDDIYLTNVFKCLLPDDREPRAQEYRSCKKVLAAQIAEFLPKKMVALGQKAYNQLFPDEALAMGHRYAIGRILQHEGVPTLILPHPREIWYLPKAGKLEQYLLAADFLSA